MVQRKIKVLVVTYSFPTKHNPTAGIFILNQLKELKEFCEIKVLCPYAYVPKTKLLGNLAKYSEVGERETVGGFEVYHPKYLMLPRAGLTKKFLSQALGIEAFFSHLSAKKTSDKIMKDWNPEIIHIHSSMGEGLIGSRLKKRYKKPLVVTLHGEDITKHSKKILSKQLTEFTLKNADAIIPVSKFLESEIKNLGIKNKKFFVIPMGANAGRFRPKNSRDMRKRLKLPLNKKIILFVGHLVERKGVIYLIRAMKDIIKKESGALCIIIGKGIEENKLKDAASELGLESHINFLGQKTNEEVAPYMNACDILALPSLNEGLPVVLCEALASGKPVVATAVAGTPELVTKDVGFLVKPGSHEELAEKIILALNKRWSLKKILERAKLFSAKYCAERVARVYRGLLKNR